MDSKDAVIHVLTAQRNDTLTMLTNTQADLLLTRQALQQVSDHASALQAQLDALTDGATPGINSASS